MNFTNKVTHDSAVYPEVRYMVRTLNVIQRAMRDMEVAEDRLEYTNLHREFTELAEADMRGEAGLRLAHKIDIILGRSLIPAALKAGLVSIEGLSIDDTPATVESLIESGPEALIQEIFEACETASSLPAGDSKNLPSLGGSAKQTDGKTSNTTAESASGESST